MKIKARFFCAVLSAIILMTGCSSGSSSQKDISSSDSSQGGYVDVSQTQEKLEKEAKREVSDTVEITISIITDIGSNKIPISKCSLPNGNQVKL